MAVNEAVKALLQEAKKGIALDELVRVAERKNVKISRNTIATARRGELGPNPKEETLEGLARVFDVDVRDLREAVGRQRGELGPWEPPKKSASLTRRQREALNSLILSMVEGEGEERASTEKMTGPEEGPDAGGTAAKPKPKRPDSGGSVTEVDFGGGGLEELAADRQDGPSAYQDQARRQDAAGTENQDS